MRLTPALIVRLAAAPLAALAFMPGAAQAQESIPASGIYKTGQQIYDMCTSKNDADVTACEYFLMATHDTIIYYQDIGELDKTICVPNGTNSEVIRGVAVDYWRSNPNSRKYSAVSSFRNALVARYPSPC
jgi:hypothetical protein